MESSESSTVSWVERRKSLRSKARTRQPRTLGLQLRPAGYIMKHLALGLGGALLLCCCFLLFESSLGDERRQPCESSHPGGQDLPLSASASSKRADSESIPGPNTQTQKTPVQALRSGSDLLDVSRPSINAADLEPFSVPRRHRATDAFRERLVHTYRWAPSFEISQNEMESIRLIESPYDSLLKEKEASIREVEKTIIEQSRETDRWYPDGSWEEVVVAQHLVRVRGSDNPQIALLHERYRTTREGDPMQDYLIQLIDKARTETAQSLIDQGILECAWLDSGEGGLVRVRPGEFPAFDTLTRQFGELKSQREAAVLQYLAGLRR